MRITSWFTWRGNQVWQKEVDAIPGQVEPGVIACFNYGCIYPCFLNDFYIARNSVRIAAISSPDQRGLYDFPSGVTAGKLHP